MRYYNNNSDSILVNVGISFMTGFWIVLLIPLFIAFFICKLSGSINTFNKFLDGE